MITPPALKPGDQVALLAPAGRLTSCNSIDLAVQALEKRGLKPFVHKQSCARFGSLAGTDEERIQALTEALHNPSIKAVWPVRGGYGSIRIIDKIDPKWIKQNPKWIIGFSDITTLHILWNRSGITALHGLMPVNLSTGYTPRSLNMLMDFLSGRKPSVQIPRDSANLNEKNLRARLIGGNLTTFFALIARGNLNFKDKIVFLEDVGEHLYAIDRMFQALKLAGLFHKAAALIIGQFTGIMQDNPPFPFSVKQIVSDLAKQTGIPVFFNFPAGHTRENLPLLLGNNYEIKVNKLFWELIPV